MKFNWGNFIRLGVEGASHSPQIDVTLSGLPKDTQISETELYEFMKRRMPSNKTSSTKRKETDKPVITSGINDGVLTGEDIAITIKNEGYNSSDYEKIKHIPRPGHGDYTAYMKYGSNYDFRGGGHLSGRMTVALCAAGGICKQYLNGFGIDIFAHIYSIADIYDAPFDSVNIKKEDVKNIVNRAYPVMNENIIPVLEEAFIAASESGDSLGGIIECAALGVPVGLGEPIFNSAESIISHLMFSVPAVKGIEFGAGFSVSKLKGSENNDDFIIEDNIIKTSANNHGGILGGITSGMPLLFKVAVKPTPSIAKTQKSVYLKNNTAVDLKISGMHDVCIVPRAVACVEAVCAIALTELILMNENRSE